MESRQGKIDGKVGLINAVLSGLGIGLIVLLVGVLIVALLIDTQMISLESSAYCIVTILLVASFVSAIISTGAGESIWIITLANTLGMLLILLLGNFMLGTGRVAGLVQTSLVIGCGNLCAVFLKLRPQKRKVYKRKKY